MGRRVFDAAADTAAHRWTKSGDARYEFLGKTLGVVGLGNIGKQVAQMADAFGMDVIFYDNREVAVEVGETLGWTPAKSIQDVFERSHCVTLHVSATDYRGRTNKALITRELLASLGTHTDVPGPKLFINYARGFVLDPADLVAAISAGEIDYGMVDVFPEEPKSKGATWVNPYAECPQVFCTPHIGAATQEAQPRIAKHVAGTTRRLSQRGIVRNCVFSPKYPISVQAGEGKAWVLAVVHCDRRGTKKAIDETIYDAGLSNMSSTHRDMPDYGIAYDLNVLNGPLTDAQIQGLIERAGQFSDDPDAIRSVRQIPVN
jgi:D-3-phosphoglycerate dehydrogenase